MQHSTLPDDSVASGPLERLTCTFLSQLKEQLQNASSISDLRVWADENISTYQNSLVGMLRRQAQRATPFLSHDIASHHLSNGLITIIPCDPFISSQYEEAPSGNQPMRSTPVPSVRPNSAPQGNIGDGPRTDMRLLSPGPLPRQILHNALASHPPLSDLASTEVSLEVMSALNMSSSWASWQYSGTGCRMGCCLFSVPKFSKHAGQTNELASPNLAGDHDVSLPSMSNVLAASPSAKDGSVERRDVLSTLVVDLNQFEEMPAFCVDGRLPGQRFVFSRPSARHTPVLRPLEEVKDILEGLNAPFLDVDSPDANVEEYYEQFGTTGYVYVCLNVLLRYNFVKRYKINVERLHRYYNSAITFIRCRNPFHNTVHASDIALAAHHFLLQEYLTENLSDEEIFAFLFSSTVMKLGHVGAENYFLIDIRHPYATSHSYFSPLRCVSLSLAFKLLDNPSCAFLKCAPPVDATWNETDDESDVKNTEEVWTHELETQMRIEVAHLLLSSDERNHQVLSEELNRMLQEGNGNIVYDRHVLGLLRNVMYALNFCYLFRDQSVYRRAATGSVAELYRQHAALAHIKKNGAPWLRHPDPEKRVSDMDIESDGSLRCSLLSQPRDNLTFSSTLAAVRALRSPSATALEMKSGEMPENRDTDKLAPNQTPPASLNAGQEDAISPPQSHQHAKEMQLVLLEQLLLPYMKALAGIVPGFWEANMRKNLEWLRGYPADEFERDVEDLLCMKNRVDSELKLCSDGFERRVFRTIFNAFYGP